MPGDPKECRQHAASCAELANTARSSELRMTLINLSQNWLKLAIELERARALLDLDDPTPVVPLRRKM
jgi:hypothetical protein